jgi:glycosyltransferase involved in cell wall biosynthesis
MGSCLLLSEKGNIKITALYRRIKDPLLYAAPEVKMRILHCLPYYAEQFKGGMQQYVKNILLHLKHSFDVDIYTTTAFSEKHYWSHYNSILPLRYERLPDINQTRDKKILPLNEKIANEKFINDSNFIYRAFSLGIFLRTPIAPFYPWGLQKLASQSYDLIHFHSPSPLSDFSAYLLRKQKYVVSIHNTFPEAFGFQTPLIKLAQYFFYKNLQNATKIIVYKKDILNSVVTPFPLLTSLLKKTVEVPPGVDKDIYKDLGMDRTDDILFVAHVRPEKGLHILIDALPFLLHKNARLVILAKVTYTKNYFQKLLNKAHKLLNERLLVITDPTDEQIQNAYNLCGCVVCPSTGLESWNFVLLEAASSGAAIVKTDLDGMAWIKEPYCLTAKVNDPKDLARKIDMALDQKIKLGQLAAQYVKQYNWERTAHKLKEVYLSSL